MKKTGIAGLVLASLALLVSPIPGGIVFAIPLGLVALGLGITALVKAPLGARLAMNKVSVSLAAGAIVIASTLTAAVPGWISSPPPTPATARSPVESHPQSTKPTGDTQPASTPTAPGAATSEPTTSGEASGDTRSPTAEDGRGNDRPNSGGRQTVVVTRVIDGDTFEARGLGRGPVPQREVDVRMLEINTVEQGQCGYEASTDKLASLLGNKVTIERDQDLKDQYGRWLLYVWSGGTFVNHEMVQEGWAEAVLYEPNDKYWERISAADTSKTYTPWPPCHTPEPPQQDQQGDDGHAGAGLGAGPGDIDCADVAVPGPVAPGDPDDLDGDGDGTGCE